MKRIVRTVSFRQHVRSWDDHSGHTQNRVVSKYKKIEESITPEELANIRAEADNSHFWRNLLNSDPVQEYLAAVKIFGLGVSAISGYGYLQCKAGEVLTDDQQRAIANQVQKSYVIIEQSDNHSHTLDYWKVDEHERLIKLRREIVPKPKWKIWLGL